jgi:(S)-citramalyl-CoA lyase
MPIRPRRSILFLPANRPDRYPKALASGADSVCVDLEDAVGPEFKAEAREALVRLLATRPDHPAELIVRINPARSEIGLRDLLALVETAGSHPPDAVMLPKLSGPDEVAWVAELLEPGHPSVELIAMIETARGLEAAAEIASASPKVSALILGGVDLSAELGSTRDWAPMLYPRSRVVHAAALARIAAVDLPYLDVTDLAGLERETKLSKSLGLTGRTAVHPTQVEPIQRIFSPTAEEVDRARRVIEAYEKNQGGVLLVDGKLIERPVILAAQRILASAALTPSEASS